MLSECYTLIGMGDLYNDVTRMMGAVVSELNHKHSTLLSRPTAIINILSVSQRYA